MSRKIPTVPDNPHTKKPAPLNSRKQGPPPQGGLFLPIPRQKINPLNAQGKNSNIAQSAPDKQVKNVIQTMARNITALRKENIELKAKLAQAQKKN
jgi:hypothetical protein